MKTCQERLMGIRKFVCLVLMMMVRLYRSGIDFVAKIPFQKDPGLSFQLLSFMSHTPVYCNYSDVIINDEVNSTISTLCLDSSWRLVSILEVIAVTTVYDAGVARILKHP